MTLWLDAQLPPQLAIWIQQTLAIDAIALRDIGLRDATDTAIYDAAKKANVVLISKDSDFVELVMRLRTPPKLIWLTCGNVSNAALQALFSAKLREAIQMLDGGEPIVELG
jgi:predicted nuclease of predicted toxin-antitoxin system